jgi:hypothetical protein
MFNFYFGENPEIFFQKNKNKNSPKVSLNIMKAD